MGTPITAIESTRDTPRPFWSVMIPTYNGDPHIADAIRSVLEQDPGPGAMQVEVVDDGSTRGDPEGLIRRIAGERVGFHRHPRNLGHVGTFNTCIRRARGQVVHILHDDDQVRPDFYARLEPPLREHPDIGAAFTRSIYTRSNGHWDSFSPVERADPGIIDGWLFRIASGQRVTTPSVVVRRSTYEAIGGFDGSITVGGEDWEMWVRIASRYPVWFEPEPLALYRMVRAGSLTGEAQGTSRLAEDMLTMTDVVASYLYDHMPPERAEAALRRARATYAKWAVEASWGLLRAGHRREALDAGRLAWQATTPAVVARAFVTNAVRTMLAGRP